MKKQSIALIGAALGWGAKRHETEWGPEVLRKLGLEKILAGYNDQITWQKIVTPQQPYSPDINLDYPQRCEQVQDFCTRLATEILIADQHRQFPIILGGDHAIAIGTWSGVVAALQAPKRFGLIWMDAHMDAHTFQTTPSQAIHGMPLAVLLGHGEPSLTHIAMGGAKLDPHHVVLIGVRSFEPGEAALLKKLGVKIYKIEEVRKLGFTKVFNKAVAQVTQDTDGFGLSIDLDVFDPQEAPGTGTPVPGGLTFNEVKEGLKDLLENDQLKALEIAEFDPTQDRDHKTTTLIQNLILTMLGYSQQ